jgi:predicted AAA+ superfamily ATPase
MNRDLYNELLRWKVSSRRKPLLLGGARQTGKTFLLQEFGRNEYESVVYCNFEKDPKLAGFFSRDLDPGRILSDLGVYMGHEIRPGPDLIVFDEVQTSNKALSSLKYFQEQANEYHVAAAGSLLGVEMSTPGSFPVGKVNFLDLHPMTFLEFLNAMGAHRYRILLEDRTSFEPLPEAVHEDLIDLLRKYYVVGGMPEAVKHFTESVGVHEIREIQHEIINSYVLDFVKHASAHEIPKLTLIWESIPKHLSKENKKFMFSAVRKGARAREYENALRWLQDAGLVHLCHSVEMSKVPLKHYADRSCFKVYVLDVGLLGAMVKSPPASMVEGQRLFNEYEGALVENYVAQQLMAGIQPELYYWRSRGGKAELDFLCELKRDVVPMEVKAGYSRKSRSMRSFDQQFSPRNLVRANLLNAKRDGKVCNLSLYAVSQLRKLISGLSDGGAA